MRFFLILFLLISKISFGQNDGLYGRNFCVDLGITAWTPVFANNLSSYDQSQYRIKNGTLTKGKDLFDYGFKISISQAVKSHVGIGIDFGKDFSSLAVDTYQTRTNDSLMLERIKVNYPHIQMETWYVIPKIELTSRNGLLPVGLNHQLGIGWNSTRLIDNNYAFEITHPYYFLSSDFTIDPKLSDTANFSDEFYDFNNKPETGIVFLYGLNIRTPLSKHLLLSYGIRYTYNFYPKSRYNGTRESGFWYTREEVYEDIRKERSLSIISFSLGLALTL